MSKVDAAQLAYLDKTIAKLNEIEKKTSVERECSVSPQKLTDDEIYRRRFMIDLGLRNSTKSH